MSPDENYSESQGSTESEESFAESDPFTGTSSAEGACLEVNADVAASDGGSARAHVAEFTLAQLIIDLSVEVRDLADVLEALLGTKPTCLREANDYLSYIRMLRCMSCLYKETACCGADRAHADDYAQFDGRVQAAYETVESAIKARHGSMVYPLPATHPRLISSIKHFARKCQKLLVARDFSHIAFIPDDEWNGAVEEALCSLNYQVARLLYHLADTPSAEGVTALISDDWVFRGVAPASCQSLIDAVAIAQEGGGYVDVMLVSAVRLKALGDLAADRGAMVSGAAPARVAERFNGYLDALERWGVEDYLDGVGSIHDMIEGVRGVAEGQDKLNSIGLAVADIVEEETVWATRFKYFGNTLKVIGLGFSLIKFCKSGKQDQSALSLAKDFASLGASGCATGALFLSLFKRVDDTQIKILGGFGTTLGVVTGTLDLVDAYNNNSKLEAVVPILQIGAGALEVVTVMGTAMGVVGEVLAAQLAIAGSALTVAIVVTALLVFMCQEINQQTYRSGPATQALTDILEGIANYRFTNVVTGKRARAISVLFESRNPFEAVSDDITNHWFFGLPPVFGVGLDTLKKAAGDHGAFCKLIHDTVPLDRNSSLTCDVKEELKNRSACKKVLAALGFSDGAKAESLLFWTNDEIATFNAQARGLNWASGLASH